MNTFGLCTGSRVCNSVHISECFILFDIAMHLYVFRETRKKLEDSKGGNMEEVIFLASIPETVRNEN